MRNGIARTFRGVVGTAVVAAVAAAGVPSAGGDEGVTARSCDAVAKERQDEYVELRKKGTTKAARERLEILNGLGFCPCGTAQRFLLGLVSKASTPGDERLHAVDTLVKIADGQGVEDLLAALGRAKDPTLWQAFGEALADRHSASVRAWFAEEALENPSADVLCAVLEALTLRSDPKRVPRLSALYAKHAKSPGGVEVAHRALLALAATRTPEARAALLEAVRHDDARLRLVAADRLPGWEPFDPEIEAAVRGLLQDGEGPVRQTAAAQAGAARRAAIAPALVGMLADPRARTRHVAATALERISGQKLGQDVAAWSAWLRKEDPGAPRTVTVPTYHGLPVHTDRVVFLVDASSSMTWPWSKAPHRIDVARAELASVLRSLPPETQFNVLAFAERVSPWRKAEAPATKENVAAALAWAEKALAEPAGDTHLFEALEVAYATDPQFDTAYLLTDGNPTAGRLWTLRGLRSGLRVWNRYRRTAVHAIGLSLADEDRGRPNLAEDLQVMAQVLGAIAGDTGGEYREVLRAP
jgi:hypothetical protein